MSGVAGRPGFLAEKKSNGKKDQIGTSFIRRGLATGRAPPQGTRNTTHKRGGTRPNPDEGDEYESLKRKLLAQE